MSIETEVALAAGWPIETTEPAAIGDHVARLYSRTAEDTDPDQHFGALIWSLTEDERPEWSLAKARVPGAVCFADLLTRIAREFQEVYRDAGFYPDPRNNDPRFPLDELATQYYPPRPRPCVGDPRMDPTVLVEGCMAPWDTPSFFYGIEEPEDG
jgi:hypothetical protein